jgi:hypothetical protein
MATYTIQKSKTNSKFIVIKDGNAMAACHTYGQASSVLNRMQRDDVFKSINDKYEKKLRILNAVTTILFIVSASIMTLSIIFN